MTNPEIRGKSYARILIGIALLFCVWQGCLAAHQYTINSAADIKPGVFPISASALATDGSGKIVAGSGSYLPLAGGTMTGTIDANASNTLDLGSNAHPWANVWQGTAHAGTVELDNGVGGAAKGYLSYSSGDTGLLLASGSDHFDWIFDGNARPKTDNTYTSGTPSRAWNNVYSYGLHLDNSTVPANSLLYSDGSNQVAPVTIGSNLTLSSGTLSASSYTNTDTLDTVTNRGASTANNISTGGITASGNVVPFSTNTYSIGGSSAYWSDGYLNAAHINALYLGASGAAGGTLIATNGTPSFTINFGTTTPEGSVSANPGSLFIDTSGGAGATLWVKESGTGDTGWSAK